MLRGLAFRLLGRRVVIVIDHGLEEDQDQEDRGATDLLGHAEGGEPEGE